MSDTTQPDELAAAYKRLQDYIMRAVGIPPEYLGIEVVVRNYDGPYLYRRRPPDRMLIKGDDLAAGRPLVPHVIIADEAMKATVRRLTHRKDDDQ